MNLSNNKGAVLIAVYMALFVLVTLSSSVALFNFTELNDARRHQDTTAAFWLAEAGINQFLADPEILNETGSKMINEENGMIEILKDDSNRKYRLVTSTGTTGGSRRSIQIKYPALSTIFESTMSTKGSVFIEGRKSSLMINDKLRLGGNVINTATYPLTFFEDVQEGVNDALVSITYPDADGNGTPDEFSDFIAFYRNLIASYPEDEVVYIQGNDTYTITPDESLEGKKIIYIEGRREGEGNAIIQFTGALEKGQSLTVIATGTVTHNQAGLAQKDSQLNIIAWSDYFETAALPSIHNGMIYTHGSAYFDEMHDTSVTNGSVVANEGIIIREVWSTKTFNYADMRKRGVVPPGFEGLVGGGVSGYTKNPSSWREI
ncbi:MAG: hypothetical protein KAS66_10855 [Candidatus Omnitrophica bacterium]|nr:hypothetical protein [Candidatus Omnitrophota bacterium]